MVFIAREKIDINIYKFYTNIVNKYLKGGKNMDRMADILGRVGTWCGQNKYLSAIKNAFQSFMPLIIAGAVGVLWSNVLVNTDSGLGAIWKPIMVLEFLNPAFDAINFAAISCITVGITFGIAQEIGSRNLGQEKAGYFPGMLGVAAWLSITQTNYNYALVDTAKKTLELTKKGELQLFTGISEDALGASGLCTGMIVGIVSIELFCWLVKKDSLKIRMPETVPIGIARVFEDLVPAIITIVIIALCGLTCNIISENLTGNVLYLNDIIRTSIQGPLSSIGASLPGIIVIYLIIMLFWLVGIHGNNMLSAVKESLFTPLALQNMENYKAHKTVENISTMQWLQMTGEFGGSGVTIGLVVAILIFSTREDNYAVATLSIVPSLFNINETVIFGIPMVLNPILGIPFVLAPIITITIGYVLTLINFCPKVVLIAPWTTPPIIFGFIATGANPLGAVTQGILLVVSVLVYTPFFIIYERMQNKQVTGVAQ